LNKTSAPAATLVTVVYEVASDSGPQ